MRNNHSSIREIENICNTISICTGVIDTVNRVCLTRKIKRDHRGSSSNPNHITADEIRLIVGLPKGTTTAGYKWKILPDNGGIVKVISPTKQEFFMPWSQLRGDQPLQKGNGTGGGGSNNLAFKTTLYGPSDLSSVAKTQAEIQKNETETFGKIAQVILALGGIIGGIVSAVNTLGKMDIKSAKNTLREINSGARAFKNYLARKKNKPDVKELKKEVSSLQNQLKKIQQVEKAAGDLQKTNPEIEKIKNAADALQKTTKELDRIENATRNVRFAAMTKKFSGVRRPLGK